VGRDFDNLVPEFAIAKNSETGIANSVTESTLKRHGYYCRSRKGGEQASRSRACIACAKAKARCDNLPVACGRCASKNIQCIYRSRKALREETQDSSLEEEDNAGDRTGTEASTSTSPKNAHGLTACGVSRLAGENASTQFGNLDDTEELFRWDMTDFAAPKLHTWDYRKSPVPIAPMPFDLAISRLENEYPLDHMSSILETTMPMMPTYEMRCFTRRPTLKGAAHATATMMTHILTSYPPMMRNPASPPPFIHPSSMVRAADNHQSHESLATCASLMGLLGSGSEANRKLVWKNVRLECERLHAEVRVMPRETTNMTDPPPQWSLLDKWALLSSMQALLVYMLLRLSEGETPHNNFDVPLLSAMWVVACALNQKIDNYDCTSPLGLSHGTTHEDWIFEESRRRFSIAFRTLSMLFTTDPGTINLRVIEASH